ncbi:hypothetical protein D088_830008 [Salmonella enterica subsp. houtenae serovar 16:z4,z32:-- str. RKS3027]|nr:hypothetical protein D088_830008 [Salmonella enterica subsp. houtenae serovar 16:z4,z32:-- str. RKS3027]
MSPRRNLKQSIKYKFNITSAFYVKSIIFCSVFLYFHTR